MTGKNSGRLNFPPPRIPGDGNPITAEPPRHPRPANDEVDLLKFVMTLWAGRWTIILFAVAAILASGYYAFMVADARFAATSRLSMEFQKAQVFDFEEVFSGVSNEQITTNTELSILRSRPVVKNVVEQLDLTSDPSFNKLLSEPDMLSRRWLRNKVEQVLGQQPDPPSDLTMLEATIGNVQSSIAVNPVRDTYLFDVTIATDDPQKAIDVNIAIVEHFIEDQMQRKFRAADFAASWLGGKVAELESELEQRENAVKELRENTDLVSFDALEILNLRAKNLLGRRNDALDRVSKISLEIEAAQNIRSRGNVEEILNAFDDPILRRLQTSSTNPESVDASLVLEQLDNIIARLETSLERETAQLDTLRSAYEAIQVDIRAQNEDAIRLRQLTRETEATQVLYETFLTRLKEVTVQLGLERSDSLIVVPAETAVQVAPRRSRILLLATLSSLVIGAFVVLLRGMEGRFARTTNDLETATGYPTLVEVPKMPRRNRRELLDYLADNPTSDLVEVIRNLRTTILMSNVDQPPSVLLVTSSFPGEGKTTISLALAHNLAKLDKSVLLIEGDLRRQTLDQYFPQKTGGTVLDVLRGDQDLSDCIGYDEKTKISYLLGSGSSHAQIDTISTNRFRALLDVARQQFDFVIVDTPPILTVSDARAASAYADALFYVVKWNHTRLGAVCEGIEQLKSIRAPIFGLIMSQVDYKRAAKYNYGYNYTQNYGKYYGE